MFVCVRERNWLKIDTYILHSVYTYTSYLPESLQPTIDVASLHTMDYQESM